MDVQEGTRKGNTPSRRKGNTIIDYAIGDEEVREKRESLRE